MVPKLAHGKRVCPRETKGGDKSFQNKKDQGRPNNDKEAGKTQTPARGATTHPPQKKQPPGVEDIGEKLSQTASNGKTRPEKNEKKAQSKKQKKDTTKNCKKRGLSTRVSRPGKPESLN